MATLPDDKKPKSLSSLAMVWNHALGAKRISGTTPGVLLPEGFLR